MKRFAFALTLLACASPAFAGQQQGGYNCVQHRSGYQDQIVARFSDRNTCENSVRGRSDLECAPCQNQDGNDNQDRDGRGGHNQGGYNQGEHNQGGHNQGDDSQGYNSQGYNSQGYNRQGYNCYGYNSQGYNNQGYNSRGYNCYGQKQRGR
jgi:hypothetical protein